MIDDVAVVVEAVTEVVVSTVKFDTTDDVAWRTL